MPIACLAEGGESEDDFPFADAQPCWISLGGVGVIVLGIGIGIVEFGIFGAGLLFGSGQVAGGLIAMGQAGIGLVLFAGQAGVGLTGVGQGMFGWITAYQGGEKRDGKRFLEDLNEDANDLFSFFGQPRG